MAERVYCAEAATEEPLPGTAAHVDVWLLLEYRPAWKAKALEQGGLAAPTKAWLDSVVASFAERGLKVRPQLVRQPETDRNEVRLMVARAGKLAQFAGTGYDFVASLDLAPIAHGRWPASATVIDEPQYFVCTNGQRDRCCARFGLPLYAKLRELVGQRAWQITHLGGHRFAPNVLTLPGGELYGRLDVDAVEQFVETVDDGRVAFDALRGRTSYPKLVQAAEAFAGRDGLRLLHVNGDDQNATVTFASHKDRVQVSVRRDAQPTAVLTSCTDQAPSEVYGYRRLSVRVSDPVA